jgi:hypothetical protein
VRKYLNKENIIPVLRNCGKKTPFANKTHLECPNIFTFCIMLLEKIKFNAFILFLIIIKHCGA